jgi:hypothetical protein
MDKKNPEKKWSLYGDLVSIVMKLQARLTKAAQKIQANTEAIEHLEAVAKIGYQQNNDAISVLRASAESNRVQAFQRSEQIAASLAQVKKENDDREYRQTMRDQSNVVSLQKLAASTDRGFNAVRTDVESLMDADLRLRGQITSLTNVLAQIQVRLNAPAPASAPTALPVGHEWVNKKLTGVYDSVDELDARLEKMEKLVALYEKLRKAQLELAKANGEFLVA